MELQASQNSPGFGGRECLIEGAGRAGRQVVLCDPDARGIGIMDIDKLAHALGLVFCARRSVSLTLRQGNVDADEEIDGAVAAVLVIVTFELPGSAGIGWRTSPISWTGLSSKQIRCKANPQPHSKLKASNRQSTKRIPAGREPAVRLSAEQRMGALICRYEISRHRTYGRSGPRTAAMEMGVRA
jgi:hypothetical protein